MSDKVDSRKIIAARAARELKDGQVANLGVGIPMLVTSYVPEGVDVIIQNENGLVGAGPVPESGHADPDCKNAGGQPATILPGGSFVDSVASFSLIRGGHVDVTCLGALQADESGNLADCEIPGGRKLGMGGAMDLVVGAKLVYALTEHCSKDGSPKLVKRCTFPLTGVGVCSLIITERALFRRHAGRGFVLEEVAEGYTLDDIAAVTNMGYVVSGNVQMGAYGLPEA